MSGSSGNQQGLRHNVSKPFDGLKDARETLIDLHILDGMVRLRTDLEEIYTDEREVDASHQTKRDWAGIGRFGLNKTDIELSPDRVGGGVR